MDRYFEAIDQFSAKLTRGVIQFRWLVLIGVIVMTVGVGTGMSKLEFSANYRTFFSDENPELAAFENLQATYTKNDNILFVIEPESVKETAFTNNTLSAVEALTAEAWKIPYAIRVDSVSNFQYTKAIEDDLIVEDLVIDAKNLTPGELLSRKQISIDEPLLVNQLVTPSGEVTAINVVLQYPEKSLMEVPEAVNAARALRDRIETDFSGINISLTGVSMLNNTFSEVGQMDAGTLMPLMFLVILVMAWLILRSFAGTISILLVIAFSTIVGMGVAGFFGVKLTPISMSATTVILTLAVADSIHILISMRGLMREGLPKIEAIPEAVRLNFMPVTITSVTTIVGFLSLNFSDSPPFWHLGNITAVGIGAAWLFSITLLPSLMSLLPVKVKEAHEAEWSQTMMTRLADFVIANYRKLLVGISVVVLVFIAFIPTITFNDQWVEYFDERVEFRTDSDQALKHFGLYPIEFSVPALNTGGISEPEYLGHLEKFVLFLRSQSEVIHVYSITDIMKRLNKNMHGDDQSFYRIPDNRELSAQYLLLYELSLPYGLDLNDRINVDKSATRVTAMLHKATTSETKIFLANSRQWMAENWPEYMQAQPTSAQVMFTYITDRNVQNMITGTIAAIFAIALIMIVALRSFRLGMLSMIPNGLPLLMTFGAWALLVGEVGFSVATVASISLGIIVDDTVHFLSKYVRARNEKGLSAEDSIRYAYRNVGMAIVVNTIILIVGFLVLTTSAFKLNVDMGLMTIMSILFALLLDFLFLPALLLVMGKDKSSVPTGETQSVPESL
ncbi:MAG: MMPL family transporter [Photobacterium frigidiphilum]|uniref:efflux RND transporter permease subunit n=1 Tax=Photobacterium frigidiphilum TaxID=264736 RepID=UPI003003472E